MMNSFNRASTRGKLGQGKITENVVKHVTLDLDSLNDEGVSKSHQ
jgi:hypothetical protein